ncbi:hypothetical protein [Streptomyces broussonetiae]|uniref:Uncharacterized protein n=1 Tax=Streptomyces broussonetiae TaxID=2686304 RepID=A0ABV5EAE7_9ACTN
MSGNPYDSSHGFAIPPMPPMPPGPPPAAPDGLRALAVALLNLSGLGLGYALLRRWLAAAVCLAVTAVLLFVALPADADGVSSALVGCYLAFLLLAAVHGAVAGLRSPLVWPGQRPLALALGVTLLAVPAGGAVLYDDARDEAVEKMLLERLTEADRLVAAAGDESWSTAEPDYREALAVYRDLSADHEGSRAAQRVPERMEVYYETVGAAYEEQDYCQAIEPLKYLRDVPDRMPDEALGSLATWPDDRLATSLYECGSGKLAAGEADWTTSFGQLLSTFPDAEQTAKVEPAVGSAVDRAAKGLGGDEPCGAMDSLRALSARITELSDNNSDTARALDAQAARAGDRADSGTYACGVDQYEDGDFADAQSTMNQFVKANKNHRNAERAKKIAIAAEVAQTVPEAGKRLPTTASGGSISVTVKNDSPDEIRVLYTGPVTGSLTLKACGDCQAYSLASTITPGFQPCSDGKNYPQKTISLPPGTTYFVHKPVGDSLASPASDTADLDPGYIYTECAYTTQGFGTSL